MKFALTVVGIVCGLSLLTYLWIVVLVYSSLECYGLTWRALQAKGWTIHAAAWKWPLWLFNK